MAALTKVYSFIDELSQGTHTAAVTPTVDTDVLRYTATNATPNLAWTQLSDLTVIDVNTNSSETWPFDSANASTQSLGTITVAGVDATITATGTVPTFRYIWLYNDTAANDELIGYWDNGAAVDLESGQVFTLNLDTNVLFTVV